jgi:hypothetical protein
LTSSVPDLLRLSLETLTTTKHSTGKHSLPLRIATIKSRTAFP